MVNDDLINKLSNNPLEAGIALRANLAAFISVFHYYLTREQFKFKDFHLGLIDRLQRMILEPEKHKKNLYVGMPPRFGKTQTVKYFIAWGYTWNKRSNWIMTSYGDDLVQSSSKEVKEVITSPLYRKLFGLEMDSGSTSAVLWKIKGGGAFRATTVGGVITGFGAGVPEDGFGGAFIVDDFLKASDASSAAMKKSVIDSYTGMMKSRLNKPNTPIIIIAQRLAVDDLIGYVEEYERDDWEFYLIKGLQDDGSAAWEERMPKEKLLKMKEQTPGVFWSQYQQSPIIVGGGVFKTDWWRYYNRGQEFQYRRIFICADTAMKTGQQNDFTVLGCFGVLQNGQIHLLDMLHLKLEAPELEETFVRFWNKWRYGIRKTRCSAVYVEDKASGVGLIQSVRRKGVPIVPMKPTKDKYSRVLEALPTIESGNFCLPNNEADPISRMVIAEAEAFSADMSHKHDDIIDVVCYAIEKGATGGGFF